MTFGKPDDNRIHRVGESLKNAYCGRNNHMLHNEFICGVIMVQYEKSKH